MQGLLSEVIEERPGLGRYRQSRMRRVGKRAEALLFGIRSHHVSQRQALVGLQSDNYCQADGGLVMPSFKLCSLLSRDRAAADADDIADVAVVAGVAGTRVRLHRASPARAIAALSTGDSAGSL
jgi:hypothetical protein